VTNRETGEADDRPQPITRNLLLLVGFLALVTISVFTVLLPSLEDAPAQPTAGADAGTSSVPAASAP